MISDPSISERASAEWHPEDGAITAAELVAGGRPMVLRGVARDWPIVRAADPAAYLLGLDSGAPIELVEGERGAGGRLFYSDDRNGFNFTRRRSTLRELIALLAAAARADAPPPIAAQAAPVRETLPGFERDHRLAVLPREVAPRIWIGNRVVVAPHHDMASNIAVVVAGHRRFTLFPPDQAGNLYIGPLEFTPAGAPVSLIDPEAPDFDRFPRARAAMAAAEVAELEPGDALYIPHMWWHHVRSRDAFSVLVNYWWNEATQPQPGLAPIDAMVHAAIAFAGLPPEQRAAWQAMFDQFVFGNDAEALAAFPPERRGLRGTIDAATKTRLRRQLGAIMTR